MGNDSITREDRHKQAGESKKKKKPFKLRKRIRLIPIWIKVLIALLLFSASLIGGAMFGYGVLGEGEPRDILTKDPWVKIHEIIYKETE